MPSHIFVQLGMWDEVVASNEAGYKAALDHIERKGLGRGRSEAHALQWLHYGHLQRGDDERAQRALDEAMRTLAEFPGDRVRRGMMAILARHTLETERWSAFDSGVLADADRDHSALQLAAGLSAANTGDPDAAGSGAGEHPRGAAPVAGRRVGRLARRLAGEHRGGGREGAGGGAGAGPGDDAAAEALLVEATVLEGKLNAPSGPPFPMKSAYEAFSPMPIGIIRHCSWRPV